MAYYMNQFTGSIDTAENWISENGQEVLKDLIEVEEKEGIWVAVE